MARQQKLVLTIAANGKVAKAELKNLDDAIKRIGGQADAAGDQMRDLQTAAVKAAKEAEAAGRKQAKAATAAAAATKAQADAQKAVSDATRASEKVRADSEKRVQRTIQAGTKSQLAELQSVEQAQKKLDEVRAATNGSRRRADVDARRAAADELKSAREALKVKQQAAADALASVKAEAVERQKMAAAAIAAAKTESRLRTQGASDAGRAQASAARETQRRLTDAARAVQTAQNFAGRIDAQNDPAAAMRRLGVVRNEDITRRIAEIERARQAALQSERLTAQEKVRINTAADQQIARERARLEAQTLSASTQALNQLGMRKKAQIQREIADVQERERLALSSASLSQGQRLAVERRTAEQIRALNRELARSTASDFQRRMEEAANSLQGLGEQVRGVGMSGSMFVSAPAMLSLRSIIKEAAGFEQGIANTKAVMPGVTDEELAQISAKAKEIGLTTALSAIEAAGAAEMLARNGISAKDMLGGALDASVLLAMAGGTDTKTSADLVTDVMVQFNKNADELGRIADLITGLDQNSKFDINDIRLAVGMGGGVAGMSGFDIEDALTFMALTAPHSTSGSDAGTSVKTGIIRLFGRESEKIRAELGFSAFSQSDEVKAADAKGAAAIAAATAELEAAQAALEELRRRYRGTGEGRDVIASAQNRAAVAKDDLTRAQEGAEALIAQANLNSLGETGKMEALGEIADRLQKVFAGKTDEEVLEGLEKLAGSDAVRSLFGLYKAGRAGVLEKRTAIEGASAERSAEVRLDSFEGDMKLLTSAIAGLKIALGESGFMENLAAVITKLTKFFTVLAEAPDWFLQTIMFFTILAAVVFPVLLVFGQLAIAAALLGQGLSLIGINGGVGGLVIKFFKTLVGLFGGVVGWIARGVAALATLAAAFLGLPVWVVAAIAAALVALGVALYKWRDEIWAAITWAFESSFNWAREKWDAMIEGMMEGIRKLGRFIADIYKDSWLQKGVQLIVGTDDGEQEVVEVKPQGYAKGVINVRGRGTGTSDSIPARLSAGESVITARATRFWGSDLLNGIQRMDPRSVVVPQAVPVAAGGSGGGRDLHPISVTINGGAPVSGLYGTPDAVRQLEAQQNRKTHLQPVSISRAQK